MAKPITALDNGCRFDYSVVKHFDKELHSSGMSVKYVLDGRETYLINNKEYQVNKGQYLVVNSQDKMRGVVDSPTEVQGLCIDIPLGMLNEIRTHHAGHICDNISFLEHLQSPDFFCNVYNGLGTKPGAGLAALGAMLQRGDCETDLCLDEYFYTLAETILSTQSQVYREWSGIGAKKPAHKKEIYKRLLIAREYIDANFDEHIKISQLARVAYLSQYSFFRHFKNAFGMSPYQYTLQQRLRFAKTLLAQGKPVSSVALESGFTDIYSFSKAYKRQEGIAPSQYLA